MGKKYAGKWTRETVLALLTRDDKVGYVAVERALVAIYDRQTAAEQATGETMEHNGVGFAGPDAQRGTWLVETVIAEAKKKGYAEGFRLRGKAFAMALKTVKRYAGTQLLQIARAKEAAAQPSLAVVIAGEKAQMSAAVSGDLGNIMEALMVADEMGDKVARKALLAQLAAVHGITETHPSMKDLYSDEPTPGVNEAMEGLDFDANEEIEAERRMAVG